MALQPHWQSSQTLIVSMISFKNDALTAYATTPTITTHIDLIKDILQK
jgi:hypothetical protein